MTPMMKWALPIGFKLCKHKALKERGGGRDSDSVPGELATMHDHTTGRVTRAIQVIIGCPPPMTTYLHH